MLSGSTGPTLSGAPATDEQGTKGGRKPPSPRGMPGAGLTRGDDGKAPSEKLSFQPYWGKPAVRNDRGDDGNVGIIRSPVRAIVLLDNLLVRIRRGPRLGDRPGLLDSWVSR